VSDFKFGDMVCYGATSRHEGPVMYVGPCHHLGENLIDLLGLPEGFIDHKNPSFWQLCTHIVDSEGHLPGETPGDFHVYLDGKEISSDVVSFKAISEHAFVVDIATPLPDGDITFSYLK
jgi:hypothetical protein